MAAPRPWTEQDTARMVELHGQGKTLTAVARALDRSKNLVSRRAKDAGLTWDRSRTAKATEAKVTDARARRANALLAELEILERNQSAVLATVRDGKPWTTLIRATGGAERQVDLNFLPARDAREATNARSGSAAIIDRLADHDSGAVAVRSLLTGLADALGLPDETAPTS